MTHDKQLRAHFDLVDTDGNGTIDRREFRALLKRLGLQRSEGIMNVAFQAIDLDDSGTIDFEEFKAWFQSATRAPGEKPSPLPRAH